MARGDVTKEMLERVRDVGIDNIAGLTPRQRAVSELLVSGKSPGEVGAELGIRASNVFLHLQATWAKSYKVVGGEESLST